MEGGGVRMENLDDRNHSDERERRSKRRFPTGQEVKYKMLYGKVLRHYPLGGVSYCIAPARLPSVSWK
jgi:hypothetical protein